MLGVKSTRFEIHSLADGVWAAIGNRAAGVTSNAGIVDLGSATLVIDTFLTMQAAQELRTAARILTGRDPSAVVNTHWHFDHCLGNSVFRDCEIYSTASTRDRVLEGGPAFIRTLQGDLAARQGSALEEELTRERRPLFREELRSKVAALDELSEVSHSLQLQVPNQTHGPKFNLPALKSAWFVELRGHTQSDTMVFIPDAETLFTGDLVSCEAHANLGSGNVGDWLESLGRLDKIAPAIVVPGHGPVTDMGACRSQWEYLNTVQRVARQPDPPTIPEPFQAYLSPSLFDFNVEHLRAPVRPAPE